MMLLYRGAGAGDFQVIGDAEDSAETMRVASELLGARGQRKALEFMEEHDLRLYEGTNHFGDEFKVLSGEVMAARYVELEQANEEARSYARDLVSAFRDAGLYVRFVEIRPGALTSAFVSTPLPVGSRRSVELALAEADQRLQAGALSSVDRIHTAFKGYLRQIAIEAGIAMNNRDELPALFRALRRYHPALVATGPGGDHITRIINAMATIVDAVSPLRNDHSLAHENDALLMEPEAALYVNAVRTLFNYVQARLATDPPVQPVAQ